MGAFVIVRFMGLLDAVDDALFVALGQELQVHGQDGQAAFFGFAQLSLMTKMSLYGRKMRLRSSWNWSS